MAAVLYFHPDRPLAEVADSKRNEVLTEVVQGIYHFPIIFMSGFSLSPNKHLRYRDSLGEHPFIDIGEILRPFRWWGNFSCFVFEILNVNSLIFSHCLIKAKWEERYAARLWLFIVFLRCIHISLYHQQMYSQFLLGSSFIQSSYRVGPKKHALWPPALITWAKKDWPSLFIVS